MGNMKSGQSTFSAIDCIQNLKKAGFTPEQAEAQVKEFERSRIDLMAILATKSDIDQLGINRETELKRYVSEQTWKTIRWTSGLLALFVAMFKFVLSPGV